MMNVTDAIEIALAIFIKQILPSCSDYFHRIVRVEKSTRLPEKKWKIHNFLSNNNTRRCV